MGHDIKILLQIGEYTEGATRKDRKTLKRLASHFLLSGTQLYRRAFDTTLLKCVSEKEAKRLMEVIHERECRLHMNGHMLAKKIMRAGYF